MKTAYKSIVKIILVRLMLSLALVEVTAGTTSVHAQSQGDNLWNIRVNTDDRFHSIGRVQGTAIITATETITGVMASTTVTVR